MSPIKNSYRASLSRSQGRHSYAIIYRHPLRKDSKTCKPGRRVRSGLGTKNLTEAEHLLKQMNTLLGDDAYWHTEVTARARFDARVVNSFFRHLEDSNPEDSNPEAPAIDSAAARKNQPPLPSFDCSDYRSALLIGATGVGKSTLLCQLLGLAAPCDKFLATAPYNATVADIDVIVADVEYQLEVNFIAREILRDALEERLYAAILAACRGEDSITVFRKLLQSDDQRWRFDYTLGNHYVSDNEPATSINNKHLLHHHDAFFENQPAPCATSKKVVDRIRTAQRLGDIVKHITLMATSNKNQLQQALSGDVLPPDQLAFTLPFEKQLYTLLTEDRSYHMLVDALQEEIELRFDDLSESGDLRLDHQGYPLSWRFLSTDRTVFIEQVQRFSDNDYHCFGRLLTPLVNGLRIKGPFFPTLGDHKQPLLIMDGIGLKVSRSAPILSCHQLRRIEQADAVIVVDSALQPMQDATMKVLQALVQSGNSHKLLLCFTQLDSLSDEHLPRIKDKQAYIQHTVARAIETISNDLSYHAWQTLHRGCANCFFLANLDTPLAVPNKYRKRNRKALRALRSAIVRRAEKPATVLKKIEAAPVYDRLQLNDAINVVAVRFSQQWRNRLGLQREPLKTAEHWTRIKTLSRYLANQWDQHYAPLMPVADLYHYLMQAMYALIQQPLRWQGEVTIADQHLIYDQLLADLSRQLISFSIRFIWHDRVDVWQSAYQQSAANAVAKRASIIDQEIIARVTTAADHLAFNQSQPFNQSVLELFKHTGKAFDISVE